MSDEPGFDVTIYVADGPTVELTVMPERLRQHPHPAIAAAALEGTRAGSYRAVVENLAWVFDPSKDPNRPVYVDDASGVTLIRASAVTAVRVTDPTAVPPESSARRRPIGFVRPSGET